jgi:hypothetical protein
MSTDTHQSAGGTEFQPGQVLGGALAHSAIAAPTLDGIKPALSSAAPDVKEQEIKLKFAEEAHQYVRDYIRQADQKATFLFAGSSTLLAYLNSINVAQSWLFNPKTWGLLDVLSFLGTFGLISGAVCSAFVITPRLSGSKRGLVFFSAIQEYETPTEYAIELNSKRPVELCEAKLKHVHELSRVCHEKFKSLSLAFRLTIFGTFCAFVVLVIK